MRITNVKMLVTCPGRNYVLVKIETDQDGLYGWGDATLNGRELAVAAALENHIAPLLIGRDPDQIEDIWQYLFQGTYWRGGPVLMTALAGVDLALWDIKGKRFGLPLYSLLGGLTRQGAKVYTHCGGEDPIQVAENIHAAQERGFRVVRAQVGVPGVKGKTYGQGGAQEASLASWATERALPPLEIWEPGAYLRAVPALFERLRVELGDEIELLHDVHSRLSPVEAIRLAKSLEPYHLFFLEDPLRPEHKGSFALLRQHTSTPLAVGELFHTRWDILPLITNQWIDYIRCDLVHIGGLTEARKIAAIGEAFQVKTAWHGPGDISPIAHAANVHLDVSLTNFGVQEMVFFSEAVQEVIPGGPVYRDGALWVNDRPGLGTDVNEHAANRYPYRRAYLPTVRRTDGSVQEW